MRIAQGVVFNDHKFGEELASEMVLQPGKIYEEAGFQTSIILDRVIDIIWNDARLLAALKNICKWYSNIITRWLVKYRDDPFYVSYVRAIKKDAHYLRTDNFIMNDMCVFHQNRNCVCMFETSTPRVFCISRFLNGMVNAGRSHQFLGESGLLMHEGFFKLLFKMGKFDEWMVLFFLFHLTPVENVVQFFRYEDRAGEVVQLCQHYINDVYMCSRYWFLSTFGSHLDCVDEYAMFYSSSVRSRMTLQEYLNTGVYSLYYFKDFLDDDGKGFVSKRVIGQYRREVQLHYATFHHHYKCTKNPTFLRCCGEDVRISKKLPIVIRDIQLFLGKSICKEGRSQRKRNKKKKTKVVCVKKSDNT